MAASEATDLEGVMIMWTADKIEHMRRCAARGLIFSDVAIQIGTTRNSVAGKAQREGIQFHGTNDGVKGTRAAHKAWATKRRLARQAEL